MIGQDKNIKTISNYIKQDELPRFNIILGGHGCGKTMLAKEMAKQLNAIYVIMETKIADIRDMMITAYKQNTKTVYIIPDGNNMSIGAKNALLKITEEPPKQAYFVMEVTDLSNTLPTLISRACVFNIQPYTRLQLIDYALKIKQYGFNEDKMEKILSVCNAPGDIDTLKDYDLDEFFRYVKLATSKMGKVEGANAFKLTSKLSLKNDDNLWDPRLFLRAVMNESVLRIKGEYDRRYYESIIATSRHINKLDIKGIHKLGIIDMWIFDMRKIWR